MTRFLILSIATLISFPLSGDSILHADDRPNIIVVITDDQGYGDLSCHGNPYVKTPHLDRLAKQSTRMTDFQVSPTCAPTRAALMTGRHEFKNGVTHTIQERERMALDAITLPQVLRDAGYKTGIFGKWHLGDEDEYQPGKRGFDEVFVHGGGGIGQRYRGSCADAPGNKYFDPAIRHNGKFVKTKGFCTDIFFHQAQGWINEQRKTDSPFFCYLTLNAAHGPFVAPDKYTKRFKEQGMKKSFNGFYGMIENIDDNVGVLMSNLEKWKLEENTLLIFMTDNGTTAGHFIGEEGQKKFYFSAGMKGNKGTAHEGGTRVPAFFRWKNKISADVEIETMTAHVDLFPTLAKLAGAKTPTKQVEGRDLMPLIKNPKIDWDDRYLFTHLGRWKRFSEPDEAKFKRCAVRNERFRFENNKELYDVIADPGQKTNVIDKHPEVVKEMRTAYEQWWKETRPMMVNEQAKFEGTQPFVEAFNKQKEKSGIPKWEKPSF